MSDLISRKALLEVVKKLPDDVLDTTIIVAREDVIDLITNAPAVEQGEAVANHNEAVSHLWESIGRWSAYLTSNGEQAELSPPSWLVDAINNATSSPKHQWVSLSDDEIDNLYNGASWLEYARAIEAKLKELNHE